MSWPKRAVVTAGMPYGNKPLHFGHIGGVFVPADCYARFLRDRIGAENVRFVCGTDCYGSPINEGYRKAVESDGFQGSIADYVMRNHNAQAASLDAFDISLDIFEGSGIGHAGEVHQKVTDAFICGLYEKGSLKLSSTLQFFDAEANTFLNGRQVVGHCPVQGCKSEHGYADECDLGHQYSPEELINPISTLTGAVPEMRPVNNWYFDLPAFADFLKGRVTAMESDETVRGVVPTTVSEFLTAPVIFVKNEAYEQYLALADDLPPHTYKEAEKGKASFEIGFDSIQDRDSAREILSQAGIRFRTSKALVPFRITGNIEWGVRAPAIEGESGLTVWCWPESLWAPISFTMALNDSLGQPEDSWQDFWCSEDAQVYQFIGQDNLYFYGIAQPAMWEALGSRGIFGSPASRALSQTRLVANHHLLFGKTKASSSGAVKPPSGEELLEHYTVDQLRAHFLSLGLAQRSASFSPKPFDPKLTEEQKADPRISDPVQKEGALLNNVFNRLARSCFYEAQNNFGGCMPLGAPSQDVVARAHETMDEFDRLMYKTEFHAIMQLADGFIRYANKHWADSIKRVSDSEAAEVEAGGVEPPMPSVAPVPSEARRQVLVDSFYLLRVATLLMHPIVPRGTELICEYMRIDPSAFFSWGHSFTSNDELCSEDDVEKGMHPVSELPPRFDFFPRVTLTE